MFFLAQETVNRRIVISVTVEQIFAWIIIGLLAGLLASLFVRGRMSLPGLVLIGLIGALVGGFLFFDLLNIQVSGSLNDGILIRWIDILVAFIGSMIVLAVSSAFFYRRL
jgi:uncharacterized membrane protein YeaQ/YmgE (transglycosylase-associated protein family)